MKKSRIGIAVVEPSDCLYEGIVVSLLKMNAHYLFYRLKDLDELEYTYQRSEFSIVLLNPILIQNRIHDFIKIKKRLGNVHWVSILYTYHDPHLLSHFDDDFHITSEVCCLQKMIENTCRRCDCISKSREDLTDREIEVLIRLTEGLSNKEIADKLNISVHTVISHRKNIVDKTGIKSLPALTMYAISKHLIPFSRMAY